MSSRCPALSSSIAPPTPNFASLLGAALSDGLVGDGLVATSCAPRNWTYLFTRSTAGQYPKGSLSAFFKREQLVANCP
jgi:hypothetical protein